MTAEEIGTCKVLYREEDRYEVRCKIKQFGVHDYAYYRDKDVLLHGIYHEKCVLLGEEAKKAIESQIDVFEEQVKTALSYDHIKYPGLDLYINSDKKGKYNILIKNGQTKIFDEVTLADVLSKIPENFIPTVTTLSGSPLYEYAVNSKDRYLRCELEVFYGNIGREDLDYLESESGIKWLPRLGEEEDKNYVVDTDGMDKELLARSGYVFWHRPYFAMSGSTHQYYTINPHTKKILDSAPSGSEAMSFSDYMKLFK